MAQRFQTSVSTLTLLGVLLSVASAEPPASSDSPLAITEVRRMVEGKQYNDAIKALVRILSLKGPAATAYNRHDVLMLRSECHLQLHQNKLALQSMEAAYNLADQEHNPEHADAALALAFLIGKAPGYQYVPKTGEDHSPLDILDRSIRLAVYAALLADELPAFEQEGWQARSGVTLLPLLDVAKRFAGVRAIERLTTGKSNKTDALAKDLSRWAAKMVNVSLNDSRAQIKRITDSANRQVPQGNGRGRGRSRNVRAGLSADDTQDLRNIVSLCDQIPSAVAQLNRAFAQPFPVVETTTRADNIKYLANKALAAN